ncbi:MAG TPA: hypothetical protein VH280_24695 [Verrucomicrobiae bacterium]|jgi:hypothetical protein|nr:hypothetical protein [Verrucomicrobiae bacterium]
MKTRFRFIVGIATMGIACALAWSSQATVIFHPPRTVVTQPPVIMAPVPDFYVWDGNQFVGVVGNQYVFLGPGNVWMPMDPTRMRHFNSWATSHPNWRRQATRNTRYRRGGPARSQPMRGSRPRPDRRGGPPTTRSAGPPPQAPHSNGPGNPQNQGSQSQGGLRGGNRGQGNQGSGNRGQSGGQNNPPQ